MLKIIVEILEETPAPRPGRWRVGIYARAKSVDGPPTRGEAYTSDALMIAIEEAGVKLCKGSGAGTMISTTHRQRVKD